MKYANMKDKIVTDKFGYKFVGNSIMIGSEKRACMICDEPTEFIDVFSEGHICSEECLYEFSDIYNAYCRQMKA